MNLTFRLRGGEPSPAEIALAWRRYLEATRGCAAETYEETEEAAWQRLVEELALLGRAPTDPVAALPPLEGSQAR